MVSPKIIKTKKELSQNTTLKPGIVWTIIGEITEKSKTKKQPISAFNLESIIFWTFSRKPAQLCFFKIKVNDNNK